MQHIAIIVVVVLYLGFGGCRVKVNLEVRNWLRFGELNIPYGAVVHIGERLLVGKCACQVELIVNQLIDSSVAVFRVGRVNVDRRDLDTLVRVACVVGVPPCGILRNRSLQLDGEVYTEGDRQTAVYVAVLAYQIDRNEHILTVLVLAEQLPVQVDNLTDLVGRQVPFERGCRLCGIGIESIPHFVIAVLVIVGGLVRNDLA